MKKRILINLTTALLFSSFIYLEYFQIESKILNTIFGLLSIYLILQASRKDLFIIGTAIGILWFYWIGYSFIYYDLPYLLPFIVLFFGFAYGTIFYLIGFQNLYLRGGLFILLNLFEPLAFNWFKPQVIFINSHIGTELWQFGVVVLSFVLMLNFKNSRFSYLLLFPILFTYSGSTPKEKLPLKIKVVETEIKQDEKWLPQNEFPIVKMNLEEIKKAIDNGYDMVVLPESTFPLYLNNRDRLMWVLQELSHRITIWTGSLYYENGNYYNSSYIFQNGEYQVAKKMVLVPFGEYIPLDFLGSWVNDIFFDGADDFSPATEPTDIDIKGFKFRSAVCYEATSPQLFVDVPKYMIAISNNGWFTPSIEPTLQKLLMRHYATIYQTVIVHSANISGTGIVHPK